MLTPDGILVVASPYTWRPEYTPLENWIGGFQKVESQDEKYIDDIVLKDAENHFTVDGLKETLMPGLVLLQELKVRLSLKFLKLSLNSSNSLLLNSLSQTIPGAFCHSGRRWHVPVHIQQLHRLWGTSQNLIQKETICAFGRCGYKKYTCMLESCCDWF